uniref:Uncharacterized protein n=1 Tax=Panagrolaimus sp. PS1159 TaxID=55785 RepID=A0AC35F5R7_9BILA
MSLYFEERMNEQKGDYPENDKIVFTFPWILTMPWLNEDNTDRQIICEREMVTSLNITTIPWQISLTNDEISVVPLKVFLWNPICNVSYSLFYDDEMRYELYSSKKMSAIFNPDDVEFNTPEGFLTKFNDEFQKGKVAKIVIFVEVILSSKTFFYPFDHPLHYFYEKVCEEYPEDWENDFRYEFLKDCDYLIKCSDGYSMPALKMVLNVSSKFMHNHFKESKENEFICEHKIDVIKPVILYLHSLCFEMPKFYDLDFARRLLKAIDFFDPENKFDIKKSIQQSLCQKLAKEPSNFVSILQLISIAIQHDFLCVLNISCSLIANKYYFKWIETFPENARNPENPIFRDIFGPEGHIDLEDDDSAVFRTFYLVTYDFVSALFTNVIMD